MSKLSACLSVCLSVCFLDMAVSLASQSLAAHSDLKIFSMGTKLKFDSSATVLSSSKRPFIYCLAAYKVNNKKISKERSFILHRVIFAVLSIK